MPHTRVGSIKLITEEHFYEFAKILSGNFEEANLRGYLAQKIDWLDFFFFRKFSFDVFHDSISCLNFTWIRCQFQLWILVDSCTWFRLFIVAYLIQYRVILLICIFFFLRFCVFCPEAFSRVLNFSDFFEIMLIRREKTVCRIVFILKKLRILILVKNIESY